MLLRLGKKKHGLHLGWLTANWSIVNRDTANRVFPHVCSVKFAIICWCVSSRGGKDQAVVALLHVKDPFNAARPSPYRRIKLTSKVGFINKNEIRNYISGLLHALTCLVLGKRDDKQNLQIN